MSESSIVNFNEYGKNRRGALPAAYVKVLNEARDRFVEIVMRELSGQLGVIEGGLVGLATNSPLRETREIYSIALNLLQRQSMDLMQSCKQAYTKTFDVMYEGGVRVPVSADGDLSILDENEYEVALALDKSSARLRFNCAEELIGLDARMGVLLERPKLPAEDNPLGPKVLCEALLDGMAAFGVKQKVQLVLLNQFDLALYPELPELYQEINRLLVSKGVMPDFKAGVGAIQKPANTKMPSREDTDLLNLFDRLAQAQPAGRGGLGGGGGLGAGASGASLLGISMLEALSKLQIGALSLPSGVTMDFSGSLAGGFPNVVRELQQSPAMLSASKVETVMIDAVAMLFDYLFEDRAIPDHLKQLIAQLQVPVLKAAILDRSFFTNREHPPRRVLDLIASLAAQPNGREGESDPLLVEVEAVIKTIVNEYDQDVGVFSQAAETLTALQARRESEVEAGMADGVANLLKEERLEVADAIMFEHIRRALAEQPAPETVALFLRDHWSALLKQAFIDDGETSPHLSAHLETMRELLWSVQSKSDMDSRLMLVRILPGLLKRLREGANKASMSEPESEKFFSVLVALHAGAVRANALSVPLPEAETILDDLPEPEMQSEAASLPDAPFPEIQDEFSLQASELQKGDRVEMKYEDGSIRLAQVVWVSGIKGNYLFADANGQNMFSISPQRLADKLRSGQAVLLGHESVTENAFSKLVSFFKSRASAN